MKRPANLIYGLNESPPLHVSAFNGVQYVGLIAINLVYPLLVFRVADIPVQLVGSLLAVGMLVLGVATFLQVARFGPVGSGFMCPATFTATYLGPSLLAVQIGGLPLLFGMTLFAGLLETMLAPLLNRLRPIFPPEVSGLVIFVIGLSGGIAGLRAMLGDKAAPVTAEEWWIAGVTLGAMIALNVWGKGMARMLCALIGLTVGYAAAVLAGLLAGSIGSLAEAPWLGFPAFGHLSWSFQLSMVMPFAIAAVAAAMKAVGTIAVCQRMNDADWVRPDMRSITRGVLADGISTALAGAAGALGTNTSTPAVGLAAATGVASRTVAYAVATLFVLLALFPKLTVLLAVMPRPVVVAALLFAVTFIMINGLQVMSSRMLDARRTLVVGLAIVAGTAVEVFPTLSATASDAARPLIGSSLVFSTVIALVLNFILRIGVKQTALFKVEAAPLDAAKLEQFMETSGAAWGARRDVIDRAKFNLAQSLELIVDSCEPQGPIEVAATFDEFNLDLRVSYVGAAIGLPDRRPSNEDIIASEEGQRRLAGFMLRRYADRVVANHRSGRSTILFHFDH
ncbi:MAG TPA: solute carrier family 23 protein [Burkholderiales bacterium]|nr:solute carrier family 23 protein [Burkholderiales bacterium]